MRDRRFVAVHRGGLLSKEHHSLLMSWAYACTTHVLGYFGQPKIDERLNEALRVAKAWERGAFSVGDARKASMAAIAVASENTNPASIALATAHMADHSLRAADYALKAIKISGQSVNAERKWQDERLPLGIKDLILSVRNGKPNKSNVH
jgi:hypothetical protein